MGVCLGYEGDLDLFYVRNKGITYYANIWQPLHRPFKRFGLIPIGGRSTAVQLKEGGVWVLASSPLNDVTKNKLAELGEVRYVIIIDDFAGGFLLILVYNRWIVGADAVHYMFLGTFTADLPLCNIPYLFSGQFKKEYPNAKVIAVADAASKVAEQGLKFDGGTLTEREYNLQL